MNSRADNFLEILADHNGVFPERSPEVGNILDTLQANESPYEMRYFIVYYNEEIRVDRSHIFSISDKEAKGIAENILATERRKGTIGNFRYLVDKDEQVLYFLNIHESQILLQRFIFNSSFISIMSLFIVFIIVGFLSKKAIKPTIENIKRQRRFITDAGHEIKTPLSIIAANCEVLEIQYGRNEWIDSIQNQVRRMNILIRNLLTLSKMEEEQVEVNFTRIDITDLVLETSDPFTVLANQKGITVKKDLQDKIMINGDPIKISHLISILMDNSIKYTPDNGEMEICLEKKGRFAILEVTNSVEIMPEGDLNRLFERFHKEDQSRSNEKESYGIGLSLAKAIVRGHGGRIRAIRQGKEKISFRVELPIVK